jgi:PqqD family protein of HPr-rel-A system
VEGLIMVAVKPKVRDDLTVVELDGEAVIYDEQTADLHHLNPTATIVFGLCDGTATMAQIATDISEAFGVPETEVEGQVRGVVREFRKAKLLVPSGQSRGHVAGRNERTSGVP